MELAFSTKDLRKICEIESYAIKILGPQTAFILRKRIADLRAANNIHELISGSPKEIIYSSKAAYSVNLNPDQRIIFFSNRHSSTVNLQKVDWKQISRIIIVKIEKSHE